ncbi:hypothetical protein Taro_051252 [Colocasia esculenta]|uniref:Pentatricopeptide repeat-containing protein n=1 Tax=Colocasia esculenta TaxID=4460 RepID=A0A843XGE5_COLES|nr:hypothetical protein [Colocasia esculenta]
MRWVGAKLPPLLGRWRPSAAPLSTRSGRHSLVSLSAEPWIVDEIRTILSTLPSSMEPHLDGLARFLNPHVVSAVLEDPPAVRPAFRFFVWASRRKSLCSWLSHNLVVSMLRSSSTGLDFAWETLEELRGSGAAAAPPPAAAFEVLISAYAAQGSTDKAVECFQRMVAEFGSRRNTFTYNTLMWILIQEGMSLLAHSLYSLMLKADCRPNRSTYTILIDGLCKDGKTDDALALFDEMSQRRISPNTLVYTVVLSGLCRANRIADANKLLDSMTQNRVRPDSVTYNALIDGFCKMGCIDKAFELVNRFREEGPSLSLNAYSSLIDGLFRAGKFEEACLCYRMMLEDEKVAPDCVLFTIMIKGHMEASRIREAFAFLGEMTDRGINPDTFCYNTLIKGLCDMGFLDRARSLQLEISNNRCFPDAATYTIMICGLCDRGLINEAKEIFEEMDKYGCVPTVVTFNALIKGLCKAKMLEEGRNLLYKMEMGKNQHLFIRLSQGPNPVSDRGSLHKEVEHLCESGRIVEAYKLLRGLADSGVVPDMITYNILISGFCNVEDINVAIALFKELRFKGYVPDAVTYSTLVGGYLQIKKVDKAIEVFCYLARNRFERMLPIYNRIMKELCKLKRVWQAVSLWFHYISQRNNSLSAEEAEQMAAAQKHSEQGSVWESVKFLVEMGDKLDFRGPLPYARWMIAFCQVGQLEEAFKIFSVLVQHNIEITSYMYARLIQSFCRGGRVDWALVTMLDSLDKGILFERPVGNRLLKYLWDQNKKDALKLACRMSHAGYILDIYLRKHMKHCLRNYGLVDVS